jgi:hypothetical protein
MPNTAIRIADTVAVATETYRAPKRPGVVKPGSAVFEIRTTKRKIGNRR